MCMIMFQGAVYWDYWDIWRYYRGYGLRCYRTIAAHDL